MDLLHHRASIWLGKDKPNQVSKSKELLKKLHEQALGLPS